MRRYSLRYGKTCDIVNLSYGLVIMFLMTVLMAFSYYRFIIPVLIGSTCGRCIKTVELISEYMKDKTNTQNVNNI